MATSSISPEQLISQVPNTFVVGYSEVGKNNEGEEQASCRILCSGISLYMTQ